jgi:hypothetical protein
MDVVYPLASGRHGRKKLGSRWDNNELRYSLRSIEQYFPNLDQVVIVTEILPDWLQNVVHIYAKDTHRRNKDANLIDKVLLACKAGVSIMFVRMSDDQCLLKKWNGMGIWHMGDRANFQEENQNKWWKRFANTCRHLEAHGHPTYFYDCHCPIFVHRDRFIRIAEEADYRSPPGMCINTLYCNSVQIPREQMNGQKVVVKRRMEDIQRETEGKLFLGYSDVSTNKGLKKFLEERFPEKSRFEK